MYTISAIMFILGACLVVLFLFIAFTDVSFVRLIITMVPVLVYGFFLNYNVRRMVLSNDLRLEAASTKHTKKTLSVEPSASGLKAYSSFSEWSS